MCKWLFATFLLLHATIWTTSLTTNDHDQEHITTELIRRKHHDNSTSWCGSPTHSSWHKTQQHYYTLLKACRFPDCQRACVENNATLAMPTSQQELDTLMSFVNIFTGDVYLGLYLPMHLTLQLECHETACDGYLLLANNSAFQHAPWMLSTFDRDHHQPRCFKIAARHDSPNPSVTSVACHEPLAALCQADCPRPGPPIAPPPIRLQRALTLEDGLEDDIRNLPASAYTPALNDLPFFPTDRNFGAPKTTTNDFDFVGFDCSHPEDVTPVQMEHAVDPCGHPAPPLEQRNQSFVLLQKADRLEMAVTNCQISETIVPFYCGKWSHTVLANCLGYFPKRYNSASVSHCGETMD